LTSSGLGDSATQCSFAGGCKYEVKGTEGLTTQLKNHPNDYYVKICEKKCTFLEESTAGNAVCHTPGVSTTYSNANFDIEREQPALDSGKYFGSMDMEQIVKAFNGVLTDR